MIKITPVMINGKKSYELFIKVRDKHGRQVARRRRFSSERLAKIESQKILNELEGKKDHYTWEDWYQECSKRVRIEFKESTYLGYKGVLEKWVNPHWNDRLLHEITSADVHELIFGFVDGVSHWHRKNILKYVRRLFSMALEEGLLSRNPALKVKVKVPEVAQKVLAPKEIEVLLKEAKTIGHRYYDIWVLALMTGMRSGELYALRWTSVDLETGFINITTAWTRQDGFGPTKSSRNRVVPISAPCMSFLKELRLRRGSEEFVLPHLSEWSQGAQAQVLKEFCEGLGITAVKFHDLRATFITQLLRNGVALAKVMAIVGHSQLKTTQGYLRLCGQDVKGATDELGIHLPEEEKAENVIELNFGGRN